MPWCRMPVTSRSGRRVSSPSSARRKDAVWAITDRNKDGTADEVKRFAPSLAFDIPNGPCFSKDGFLYIAERNRILRLPGGRVLL